MRRGFRGARGFKGGLGAYANPTIAEDLLMGLNTTGGPIRKPMSEKDIQDQIDRLAQSKTQKEILHAVTHDFIPKREDYYQYTDPETGVPLLTNQRRGDMGEPARVMSHTTKEAIPRDLTDKDTWRQAMMDAVMAGDKEIVDLLTKLKPEKKTAHEEQMELIERYNNDPTFRDQYDTFLEGTNKVKNAEKLAAQKERDAEKREASLGRVRTDYQKRADKLSKGTIEKESLVPGEPLPEGADTRQAESMLTYGQKLLDDTESLHKSYPGLFDPNSVEGLRKSVQEHKDFLQKRRDYDKDKKRDFFDKVLSRMGIDFTQKTFLPEKPQPAPTPEMMADPEDIRRFLQ